MRVKPRDTENRCSPHAPNIYSDYAGEAVKPEGVWPTRWKTKETIVEEVAPTIGDTNSIFEIFFTYIPSSEPSNLWETVIEKLGLVGIVYSHGKPHLFL